MRTLGKTWILNKVFNRDTDALKVELGNDENGPLLTEENPGNVVLRGNDGSILGTTDDPVITNSGDSSAETDSVTVYEALQDGGSSSRIPVVTAGTRVAVASVTTPCVGVSFQAYETNTNRVTIGFSDVVGAAATRKGIRSLEAEDYHYQPIIDASKLYIDSVVNGEGCIVTIHTRSY